MSLATRFAGISPFGPIFGKELRTTARRRRTYFLRVAYIGLLLFPLIMAYIAISAETDASAGVAMRNQEQAQLGEVFFAIFAVFSVFMMGLIGPVLTANAISSERLQKTLPVLLMTPISAWQIVAGKLFSRLLVSFTLIGLGLPVLALVRLLGGVELSSMLGVIALALIAAMSSAAIGLFFSTLLNRAYAVILLSIGTMLFLYAFIPVVIALVWHAMRPLGGPSVPMFEVIMAINPYWMVFGAAIPDSIARGTTTLPWAWCIGTHLALTAGLLIWSAMVIRRRARRAGAVSAMEPGRGFAATPALPPPLPTAVAGVLASASASPVLSYRQPNMPRPRREVADNPILWRETRRPLFARLWQRIVALCIIGGMLILMYVLLAVNDALKEPQAQAAWACIFNALLCILTLVISSTAIAQEKESDTWTLLLATPVSGRTIIWGKALGIMRRLLWPYLFICAHFLLFTLTGIISPGAAMLAVWIIFSANTIWIATGIYFSLLFKHVTVAVIANLLLAISLYLVLLGVFGLLSTGYDRNARADDMPQNVFRIILLVVGLLIAGLWLLTLFHSFVKPRGALGRLIIITLLLIPAVGMLITVLNSTGEPIEQIGWYTPYLFLAELPWRRWDEFHLTLPNDIRLIPFDAAVYCIGFGIAHIVLASAVLGLASLKCSGVVGRALQGEPWLTRRKRPASPARQPILSDAV